jgi:glycosyltransferase involved in cell wall biosynthesis
MINTLVSIVVPVKNSANTLELCLSALARQSYQHIEIIIVDNGSADQTVAIAKRHGAQIIRSGGRLPAARNAGARIAAGKYQLHIDSDMELDPESVAQCMAAVSEGADAVTLPEQNVATGYWMRAFSFGKELGRGVPGFEGVRFISRARFEQVSGFDESLLAGEDRDFFLRLAKVGARFGRIQAITKHHVEHLTIGDIFKKTANYTRTRQSFTQKHPSVYRNDKANLFRLLILRRSMIFRSPVIALGWLILTASFVVRDTIILFNIKHRSK